MTKDTRTNNLYQFFAGYFNEDWDLEDAGWASIVDRYIKEVPLSELQATAQDVAWLASQVDAKAILFDRLGCYYDPASDGLTVNAWLALIADHLQMGTKP